MFWGKTIKCLLFGLAFWKSTYTQVNVIRKEASSQYKEKPLNTDQFQNGPFSEIIMSNLSLEASKQKMDASMPKILLATSGSLQHCSAVLCGTILKPFHALFISQWNEFLLMWKISKIFSFSRALKISIEWSILRKISLVPHNSAKTFKTQK